MCGTQTLTQSTEHVAPSAIGNGRLNVPMIEPNFG